MCYFSGGLSLYANAAFPVMQAFPEAAAFVLCFCQHAELSVCLAGHHLAHSAQPAAGDPHRGVPQTSWTTCSTGRDKHFCRFLFMVDGCVYIFSRRLICVI